MFINYCRGQNQNDKISIERLKIFKNGYKKIQNKQFVFSIILLEMLSYNIWIFIKNLKINK